MIMVDNMLEKNLELKQAFEETTKSAIQLININKRLHKENERLNNKLSLIKGIIRTPRALDSSLAYAMVKTQIENVLGSDKE